MWLLDLSVDSGPSSFMFRFGYILDIKYMSLFTNNLAVCGSIDKFYFKYF